MASTAISAQGTLIQIGTSSGTAKSITAVAVGNPTIFTSAAHGFANGDAVTLAGVTGADAALFNGLSFIVQSKTANTFALGVDTTGKAITATGTATPVLLTTIGNIKTFSGNDGEASEIDVTNVQSTAKEYILGITDPGHMQWDFDYKKGDAGQDACAAAKVSGALKTFKITLSDNTAYTFSAFVKKFDIKGGVDAVYKSTMNLRVTGPVTIA